MQLIVNGLIAGAIYALIASGFSLIFNIERFFNLAHGAVFAAGAFMSYALTAMAGLNVVASLLISVIFCMGLGVLINKSVYKPLKRLKNNEFSLLIASYGVFMLIEGIILLIFGAELRTFGITIIEGHKFLGAYVTSLQIIIFIVAMITFGAVWLFLKKSKTGKALRAVSDNKVVSKTLGIDTETMTLVVFAVGSALAGLAGVLVGMEQTIDPRMGFMAVLKGITAAIVGGIGNVPASLAGGMTVGLAENLGIAFLPSGFKDAIAFVILVIFLLFRPQGFFGTRKREDI